METNVKRNNLVVLDDRIGAQDLTAFLKSKGIDAKLVSKHAVQIHPDQSAQAEALSKEYKWGWKRGVGN